MQIDYFEFAGLDEGGIETPICGPIIRARKETVFAFQGKFPFVPPMSDQIIGFGTGGTRILVPVLKSVGPICAAMIRLWVAVIRHLRFDELH